MRLDIVIPEYIVVPTFVIDIDKIQEQISFIDDLLSQQVEADNIETISELLQELSSWYVLSGNIVASTKFYNDLAYKLEFERVTEKLKRGKIPDTLNGITSPSVIKEYIRSRVASWNALQSKAERQNSGLTHRIEALRSLLSKEKEVYRQNYQSAAT